MSLTKFILDISDEFKVMHFTSSNLLHDFPNGKYKLFSFYIYIYISCEKNEATRPDPTRKPIDLNPFLTRLK